MNRNDNPNQGWFWCDKCDCMVPNWIEVAGETREVRYCPNCAAPAKEDEQSEGDRS